MIRLMGPVADIGRATRSWFATTGRVVSFTARSLAATVTTKAGLNGSLAQASLLTTRCLIPVVLVAGPIGAMLAMQAMSLSTMFGVDRLLPPLVSSTVVREIAPGFTGVMVAFQAGAAIAAELGTMRVRNELDALEVMGVNSRGLVVGPRVFGAIAACVLLNALAIVAANFGAWLIAVPDRGMSHTLFIEGLFDGFGLSDLALSEVKSVIFGCLVGGVSATFGYAATGGPRGVGKAANRAVVATVILILVGNYVINSAVLGFRGGV
jgi:phospholipid/cholesterol/gamma-HCH transport system permease protein